MDERSSGPGLHTGLVTRSAGYGSGIPPLGEERSPGEAAPHLTTLNPAMQRQMVAMAAVQVPPPPPPPSPPAG